MNANTQVSITNEGAVRIAVRGQLDVLTVGEFRATSEQVSLSHPKRLEIELSSLRMLDSRGVGALVSLYKRVRQDGGQVAITGACEQPLAILKVLRLDRIFAQTA